MEDYQKAGVPEYVVLGEPTGDCCGGSWTHGAAYLGAEHAGVRLNPEAKEPLAFVVKGSGMSLDEQMAEFIGAEPIDQSIPFSEYGTTNPFNDTTGENSTTFAPTASTTTAGLLLASGTSMRRASRCSRGAASGSLSRGAAP